MRALASAALMSAALTVLAQNFVPGRVLVKFREDVAVADAHRAIVGVRGTTQKTLDGLATKMVAVPLGTETSAVMALRASSLVEYAEVDGYASPASMVPNDPWYAGGVPGSCAQWGLLKINAPTGWDITTGAATIKLAIIDTGVDSNHEDMANRVISGWNVGSNNGNTMDTAGHGTVVAGTAGAHADNLKGVASVAWNVQILPIRVTNSNGSAPFSNFVSAINYAKQQGAKVANISWTPMWGSGSVLDAARNFRNAGGLVVVAAGNNGVQLNYSDFQELLVVGATDPSDVVTSYSNYGNLIDMVAPGATFTTTLGGGYGNASGTSVATPYVAGAAALLWSLNPDFTSSQVEAFLESSAKDLGPSGYDNRYGNGRLDLFAALVAAGGEPGGGPGPDIQPPVVDILSPAANATVSGSIQVLAEASDNVGVTHVQLLIDNVVVATKSSAPYSFDWDTTAYANGSHGIRVRAFDAANNYADDALNVTVENTVPQDAKPPAVGILSPTAGASVSGNVSIQAWAEDNVAVAFVEFWVDGTLISVDTTAPYSATWDSRSVPNGAHTLTAIAEDTSGNRSSDAINVVVSNVIDTTAPTVAITSPANGARVGNNFNVSVSVWDNIGVVRSELYLNGVLVDTSTTSPFTLSCNLHGARGTFELVVKAYDAANNVGTSPPITVRR